VQVPRADRRHLLDFRPISHPVTRPA
jgi:hypothetical protein